MCVCFISDFVCVCLKLSRRHLEGLHLRLHDTITRCHTTHAHLQVRVENMRAGKGVLVLSVSIVIEIKKELG